MIQTTKQPVPPPPTTTTVPPRSKGRGLSDTKSTSQEISFHLNLLRESNEDVFEKYKTIAMLGQGSMGAVSKVQLRHVGGSAYQKTTKGPLRLGVFKSTKTVGTPSDGSGNTEHYYALKSIQLDRVSPSFLEELENEINILRSLDHPHIVKAREVFKHKHHIYLVMELCDGGDLYGRMPYSERDSARIMTSLLSAVQYLHQHHVVHRDLKFENIMFETNRADAA
jgi:serine/threonine protein kinase